MIKEIKALDEVIENSNSKEIEILMELLENKRQYASIVLKVKECEEAEDSEEKKEPFERYPLGGQLQEAIKEY